LEASKRERTTAVQGGETQTAKLAIEEGETIDTIEAETGHITREGSTTE
jgi:hypothetical protein